ncbi:MAG: proline dehydrogenase family protein, partial [Phycisphaerae bacterium]|nr:proline dehydrogenase family protein [Phycisphaerae bacterium]
MSTNITKQQVEELTQRLGREMFARTRAASAGPLRYEWWEERMMQQFMQYEWLKVQAFRFIDAMPTLNESVEVARHMREYFVHPQYLAERNGHHGSPQLEQAAALAELEPQKLDHRLYRLVSWLMNFRRLDSASARFFVWLSRKTLAMMASGFIAGQNVDEAVKAIRKMRKNSLAFTIDVLGEAAVSASEAESYLQRYMTLITELPRHATQWSEVPLIDRANGQQIPRVNVSVKITSLYPGFDPLPAEAAKSRAKERMRPLMRKAMEGGVHLHLDMEHYAIKDLTLELFEELLVEDEFRDYPHFGIVLQAYLTDGDKDAHRIVEYAKRRGTPVGVRLVKGAYWDSETVWAEQRGWPCPVWMQKWQSDA